MRSARIAAVILYFTAGLLAQSARVQATRARVRGATTATDSSAADRPSIDATIFDLQRVTVATDSDIADLDIARWKSGWRTAWLKSRSHKQEAEQVAASLQRNLRDAIPDLISQVQDSRGSVSTAFQLYNDLNVVVESLDSLIASIRACGRAGDSGALAKDYAALSRVRKEISSYIEVAAGSLEPRTKAPGTGAPATLPKKAGSDDNGRPFKPAKKKTAALTH
jgi:hypothetical protein